jgi:hypothetical protein
MFKSNGAQFVPILGTTHGELKLSLFVIGVFCGNIRPASLSHELREFVEDCKNMEKDSLVMSIKPSEYLLLCNAPARAFVKGAKCCGGYGGLMNVNSMVLGVVRSLSLKLQLHYEKMRNLMVIRVVKLEKCHHSLN